MSSAKLAYSSATADAELLISDFVFCGTARHLEGQIEMIRSIQS